MHDEGYGQQCNPRLLEWFLSDICLRNNTTIPTRPRANDCKTQRCHQRFTRLFSGPQRSASTSRRLSSPRIWSLPDRCQYLNDLEFIPDYKLDSTLKLEKKHNSPVLVVRLVYAANILTVGDLSTDTLEGISMSSPRPQTLEGPLGIPVFCPSAEEFQDFYGYVKSIQSFGHQYGLVKVIPPEGYAQKTLDEALQTVGSLSIRSPIRQEFSGGGLPSGCYRQLNLDVRKTFSGMDHLFGCKKYIGPEISCFDGCTVADWFAASREPNHQTPILKEDGKIHIAPTAAGYSGMKRRGSMGKETPPAVSEEDALTMKDEDEEETKDVPSSSSVEKESSSANCSTEEGPAHPPEEDLDSDQTLLGVDGDESEQPAKRFKGSPLNPELEEYIRHGASKEYADIGLLKDLERFYWKNLSYLSPMYGADLLGTLFEPEAGNSWNVAALDNLLTRIQIPIAGVNTPYLYFGHWKATFAWHLVRRNCVFILVTLQLTLSREYQTGGHGPFFNQVGFHI